jgi:hypothetical protein
MREAVTVQVQPGQTLHLHSDDGPVGELAQIPEGVASVTVIVVDTERLERARARQAKQRAARQRRARQAGAQGGAPAAKRAGAPVRPGRAGGTRSEE